jgi:hypothetical protein
MGALPALNLAIKVASLGVMLQAPMLRFDKAVHAYLNDNSPLVPIHAMRSSIGRCRSCCASQC